MVTLRTEHFSSILTVTFSASQHITHSIKHMARQQQQQRGVKESCLQSWQMDQGDRENKIITTQHKNSCTCANTECR